MACIFKASLRKREANIFKREASINTKYSIKLPKESLFNAQNQGKYNGAKSCNPTVSRETFYCTKGNIFSCGGKLTRLLAKKKMHS